MERELKINKLTDKVEALDVRGQGCMDDCAEWLSANPKTNGCVVIFTPNTSTLF